MVNFLSEDAVIKCKHCPRYWPFVRGIHRSAVNSPHKGQWRADLMLSLKGTWVNAWVNDREAGDLGRHHAHYDVIVMKYLSHNMPSLPFSSKCHYSDLIMGAIASQITSLTIVYSTIYSDADQRKHQSSASLAFEWGIHRDRWIPRTNDQ